MRTHFELEVIQNTAVGAAALWQFTLTFESSSQTGDSPDLARMMIVLPLVFHHRSVRSLHSKQFKSGLLKALYDSPELILGLQARMEAMYHRTLRSLSLASSTGLLERLSATEALPRYTACRKTLPPELKPTHDEVRMILNASKRLGNWLSAHELPFICAQLHLRY